jgi:hypothetical protein
MIEVLWIIKNLEVNAHGIIEVLTHEIAWRDWRKELATSVRVAVVPAGFKSSTFCVEVYIITATPTYFMNGEMYY